MSSSLKILAPAKVNIGLKVLHNREDGFHNIESIFQTVDLCDELEVSLFDESDKKNICDVECDSMVLPAENTLTKAYNAFCVSTGFDSGVKVFIKKKIPSGGGLGGGSSDAASFIVALSKLSGIPLSDSLMDFVASKTGSDVFFFFHSGYFENGKGCALVSGRGEIVRKISPRDDLVDKAFENGKDVLCPPFENLEKMYYSPVSEWKFANSFTPVLKEKYSLIDSALGFIIDSKADWAEMSGSGATVFGVFESEKAAEAALLKCPKEWRCVLAH